jgi:phosphate transport system permease protein
MNSTLVAGAPAIGAEPAVRAPTDWRTDAMRGRIRRRYAAERRFRLLGR